MQDSKKAKPKEAALGVHFWGFFHFWKNRPVMKVTGPVDVVSDSFGGQLLRCSGPWSAVLSITSRVGDGDRFTKG